MNPRLASLRHLPTPPDTLERHLIVAALIGSPNRLLDVGGTPGQLSGFLPATEVVTANVIAPADVLLSGDSLPWPDESWDATASLDSLEHVSSEDRPRFVEEILRVTTRTCVLCCPLYSAEHQAEEERLDEWYRERRGEYHPWLHEHIENGLPRLEEVRSLFSATSGFEVELFFHGDFRETSEWFHRLAEAREGARGLFDYGLHRVVYKPSTTLERCASQWTNRVFVRATRLPGA